MPNVLAYSMMTASVLISAAPPSEPLLISKAATMVDAAGPSVAEVKLLEVSDNVLQCHRLKKKGKRNKEKKKESCKIFPNVH